MEPALYERMAATQRDHWWFAGRRAILAELIDALNLGRQSHILEVGCGTGGNLALLESYGRVSAMEMDAFSREVVAREHPRVVLHDGALPDQWPFGEQNFDLICLFDVLEHIAADVDALRFLAGRIATGGRLVLTVPAYPWLYSSHDARHHHHRRYTATQLRQAAESAGLRVTRMGYFNTLLFPLAVVRRLLDRISGGKGSDDSQMPGAPLNGALKWTFSREAAVVRRGHLFPFGVSIAAVLEPGR